MAKTQPSKYKKPIPRMIVEKEEAGEKKKQVKGSKKNC